MSGNTQQLYQQRLSRYLTALRNETPDRVPVRPFLAEFTAKVSGLTNQDVTHDYNRAFEAACRCAERFDCDALVPNMVYVWTGLTQALGLKYYAIPGVEAPIESGFQYLEPAEEDAFMKADEYDALIDDPTAFLLDVWLPRVSTDIAAPGEGVSRRHNLALIKGGMAMMQYFAAFGPQCARLREQYGMPGAIAGILKAPLDIIGDKLRGYLGLTMDLMTQPDKVLAACEALQPHLTHLALATSDPLKQLPVALWMHRGGVPFVKPEHFDSIYWPTLKPIILELWRNGHQTMFYAEGDWNAHLDAFAELPERSIVYHVDMADIFEAHAHLGDRFCLSGGIPNFKLWHGSPEDVRDLCRKVIETVAADGGYVLDAGAIMQNDTSIENLQAMIDAAKEFGTYEQQMPWRDPDAAAFTPDEYDIQEGLPAAEAPAPGVCIPWQTKRQEIGVISGSEELMKQVWEDVDALGHMFVWQCLVSF